MDTLEFALAYLEKGLSIIPLFSPDIIRNNPPKKFFTELEEERQKNKKSAVPISDEQLERELSIRFCKRPLVNQWTQYQKRRPTEEEVREWFNDFPEANIAIVTGKISGVIVLDLDAEGAEDYIKQAGGLPPTCSVNTGKGKHLYLAHRGLAISNG